MAIVTLKGNQLNTAGTLPALGSQAPNFTLVANDLSEKTLDDFTGKKIVINIFPSVDTGTCAASVRHFNAEASQLQNTVVLCVSKDLPFAQARFCGAEGLSNVISLSAFRSTDFSAYGVDFVEGPLKGLTSRAVVILDESGKVIYTEQIAETTEEPNYEKALAVLR